MNRYEPGVSRIASGMAAVAMTAITIGVLVVLPARLTTGSQPLLTLESAEAVTPAPCTSAAAS